MLRHPENRFVGRLQPLVADDRVERGGKEKRFFFKAFLLPQVPLLHAGNQIAHGLLFVLKQLNHQNPDSRIVPDRLFFVHRRFPPADIRSGNEQPVPSVQHAVGDVPVLPVQHRRVVIRVRPAGKEG